MFTWGVFAPDSTPLPWRLVRASIAIIFLFAAVLSFERLFRPERSQSRSSVQFNSPKAAIGSQIGYVSVHRSIRRRCLPGTSKILGHFSILEQQSRDHADQAWSWAG
jgi:hypothetical protein